MFQYYSPMIFPRRGPRLLPACRPAPVLQSANNFGGWGNDFINLGTISGASILPVTDVGVTPYTPGSTEYYLCVDVAGPAAIVLPTSVVGKVYVVKDCDGDAATNPITITAVGATIDGAAAATINVNYGSLNFVFNGTEWNVW